MDCMQILRNDSRPYHLGPFPLETLPRDDAPLELEAARPPRAAAADAPAQGVLGEALRGYRELFAAFAEQPHAPQRAPLPDDLERRVVDIKGACTFMNVSQVGICRIPQSAWLQGVERDPHGFAIVMLLEHGRVPQDEPLSAAWIRPAVAEAADTRLAEISTVIARHVRQMGFAARADVAGHRKLDAERLAVLAGLALRHDGRLVNPFIDAFSLAVVSTDYPLAPDRPLARAALKSRGLHYWWGINGARSGRERKRRAARASYASAYPMETVKRVERPTTLILDDEVPRVPKRAAFFERALKGDLGEKAQRERARFATKHPLSRAMVAGIRGMVPMQDGEVNAAADASRHADPAQNARAIKALSYFLGADLTGICEVPRYAWFSHKDDGTPIEPYHRYAVVMLIDQEFDTMEGASGDDWISGAQSMRGYIRGAAIAGTMGEMLRRLGYASRAQTNADSDVLQIPLILWAGLGELSRIGELVLNPFVGPRFKSVVLTTDLPLAVDKPIDFGLQYFCSHCLKCARECPCDAIPLGDKVMFNGYETWKPDVERCTRYRVTNPHGSACGRCMKTCPINKVVDADGPLLTRAASWLGVNALWAKPLMVPIATWFDDWIGNGKRNPAKKWWFDHEVVDNVTVEPKGVNRRDIDPGRRVDAAKQKIAIYPARMMPPPDARAPVPVDRKAALAAAAQLETPAQARARIQAKE
jgi:ferredoxin